MDYYRTEVRRWNVGMKHTFGTPKQRIWVWVEWQVVALFLSGEFMRRYLSPLFVVSVFIVAPHCLLQIVTCLLSTHLIYRLSVKSWDRRSVSNQVKDSSIEKQLIFVQMCAWQYSPLHSGSTLILLSQTFCSCSDRIQMTSSLWSPQKFHLFGLLHCALATFPDTSHLRGLRGRDAHTLLCEEARAEGNKAGTCYSATDGEHKIQLREITRLSLYPGISAMCWQSKVSMGISFLLF